MDISYGKQGDGESESLLSKLEIAKAKRRLGAFGAGTLEELNANMGSMSLHALQTLCIETGCTPTGTKPFLQKKIRSEFKKAHRGISSVDASVTSPEGGD